MKYLLFLFVLFATVTAHSQCSEFDNLLKKGDTYLKGSKPNYQEAINAYTAAILACSDRAGEAKQRITRMVNEINKLKENAVAAEKKAAEALDSALVAEKKATEAQKETALERDKAQTALANLEKANADVVKLILGNADRDILNLRYEDALQKIKAAAGLGALKPEVAKAYLEIAFWHGETGNIRRAAGILDSAAVLVNKKIDSSQPHRKAIEAFDAGTYTKLMERYYPVMVQVEGGAFDMGCDPRDTCKDFHKQEVSSFHMAKYETTWWQYYLFCKATGHKYESPGWGTEGNNPAVNVSWIDALLYLNWVNQQFGLDTLYIMGDGFPFYFGELVLNPHAKKGYRLPSEAEWEYAAKGGNRPDKTIYSGSNELDSVGWMGGKNSGNRTQSVGKKKANRLGLYDMSGNVYEWCWDYYYSDKKDMKKDPNTALLKVIRGGSWYYGEEFCRTASGGGRNVDLSYDNVGFRVIFVP